MHPKQPPQRLGAHPNLREYQHSNPKSNPENNSVLSMGFNPGETLEAIETHRIRSSLADNYWQQGFV
jgi:hypothetical protein